MDQYGSIWSIWINMAQSSSSATLEVSGLHRWRTKCLPHILECPRNPRNAPDLIALVQSLTGCLQTSQRVQRPLVIFPRPDGQHATRINKAWFTNHYWTLCFCFFLSCLTQQLQSIGTCISPKNYLYLCRSLWTTLSNHLLDCHCWFCTRFCICSTLGHLLASNLVWRQMYTTARNTRKAIQAPDSFTSGLDVRWFQMWDDV